MYRILLFAFNSLYAGTVYSKTLSWLYLHLKCLLSMIFSLPQTISWLRFIMYIITLLPGPLYWDSLSGFYCIPVFSVIRYCRTTVFCVFTFSTSSFASILPRADRHDSLPNVPISFFMIPQRAHHIRLSVLRLTIFVVRRASIRFLIFCARRLLFPFRLDISHRCRRRRLRRVSELVEHKNLRFF